MTTIEQHLAKAPRRTGYYVMLTGVLGLLLVWSLSALDVRGVEQSGLAIAGSILKGIAAPELDLLFNFTTSGIPYVLVETMAIAFLGTVIGALLAVPLAFLSAFNIVPAPLACLTRFLLIVIRTVPALVYGLMFIRVTGPGPFAGVLTISLASVGMLAKLFVDTIENLDKRVLESLTSIGCGTIEKIRYGIVPQLASLFLSIVIYRFDMNLREASILGLVGAGGIGAPLIFAINGYRWSEVGAVLIGLVVLILIVEWVSNRIRGRLVRGAA